MNAPAVPYDAALEEAVIASCIGHPDAYQSALATIDADDFYSPLRSELFEACALLEDVPRWTACGVSWRNVRFAAVATIATNLPPTCETPADLAGWVAERSTFIRDGERWALDLAGLAQRRHGMDYAAELYNRIGSGESVTAVRALIEKLAALAATA